MKPARVNWNKLLSVTKGLLPKVDSSLAMILLVVGTLVAILGFCSPALCTGTLLGLVLGGITTYVILNLIDKLEVSDAEEEAAKKTEEASK